MFDTKNGNLGLVALAPVVIATDTDTDGISIDLQGANSCTFFIATGVVTDGDYVVRIEEDDQTDMSTGNAVADVDLVGTEVQASFTEDTDDAKCHSIGYIGSKRFVRLTIVSTTTTVGALIGAIAVVDHGSSQEHIQPSDDDE